MEPQEKLTTQQFIIDRLQDVQRKAEAKSYAEALTLIKEVKASDIKNIYLIAIEKQIAKLNDASLPQENRDGIVKSLPAMIERAITDVQRRTSIPKVDETQKEQKEAALEKLKSQYFQRADDYVEKHEYQRALEEIRRIYIIEPGSVVAKEYEKKIEQLAELHAREEAQAAEKVKEEKEKVKEVKEVREVREVKKAKKETPAKVAPTVEPPKEKVILEEEPKKSKLPIIAAAAVVILAIGAWLIFFRGPSATQTEQITAQTPPPTEATSTPPANASTTESKKESTPIAETSKQPAKAQKPTPEAKPVVPEKKPVQTSVSPPVKTPAPAATQPARTQPTATQPSPQPQQTPPATTTTTPQPEQPQSKATESTPAPMPFVAIESPIEVTRREPAQYPEIAIKMGIEGSVTVEVTVDAQGKPIQAKVVKSSSDIFNNSAIEAAMKSSYKPAMMSTGPVTAKVYVPYKFNIRH